MFIQTTVSKPGTKVPGINAFAILSVHTILMQHFRCKHVLHWKISPNSSTINLRYISSLTNIYQDHYETLIQCSTLHLYHWDHQMQWFAFPNLTMVTYMCVYVLPCVPWCWVVWCTYGGGVVWCGSMWCDVVWFGVHTVVWCGSVVNHCHRQEVTPLVSPLHELPSSVSYKWRILSFDIVQCTLTPIISFKLFAFL